MKDSKYITKLKRKKQKKLLDSSFFNSLKAEELIKEIREISTNKDRGLLETRNLRHFRKFAFLEERRNKGKKLTERQIRRYARLSIYLKREIPKDVLDRFDDKYKSQLIDGVVFIRKKRSKISKRKKIPVKYETYIKSSFWTKRKNQYYQSHVRICGKCGSYKQITLHHLVYNSSTFGSEPDDELVALCWDCHKKFHEIYGVKKDSRVDFKSFLIFN